MRFMKLKRLMKIKEVALYIRCQDCHVHFSPASDRAIRLQQMYGYINICKDCEEKDKETYEELSKMREKSL